MYEYHPIYRGVKLNIAVNHMDSLTFVDQLGSLVASNRNQFSPYIKHKGCFLVVIGEFTGLKGAEMQCEQHDIHKAIVSSPLGKQ